MSLARLHKAAALLADDPLGAWLAGVAARLEAGLDAATALELKGPAATRQRDALLAQAAQLTGESGAWRQAGALARRIAQLPHRRRLEPVDNLLRAAAQCARIPGSQRQLYSVLADYDERVVQPIARDRTDGVGAAGDRARSGRTDYRRVA